MTTTLIDNTLQERIAGHEKEQKRHLLRNYLALSLEGGIYMGGMSFVMPQTILPRVIESLDGPRWLIALLPTIMIVGILGPSLFVGHRVARMVRVKPLVLATGIPQRLPYFLAGILLLFFAARVPGPMLAGFIAIIPLLSGLAGGISLTAFQEFVARAIPKHRLSSLWAVRNLLSALLGMAAGQAVAVVLARWPGTTGYGILHIATFCCIMLSFIAFIATREIILPGVKTNGDLRWRDFTASLLIFIRSDPQLRRYLTSRFFAMGMQITIPFLSIHALSAMHKPDSYLGFLVMANMAGSITGNILGALLGDRLGSRFLVLSSNVGYVLLCLWAPLAHTQWEFTAIYVLLGLSFAMDGIGVPALGFSISPVDKRVAYLTSMATLTLASIMVLSLINIGLARMPRSFALQSAVSGLCVAVSLCSLWRIKVPRTVRVSDTRRMDIVN